MDLFHKESSGEDASASGSRLTRGFLSPVIVQVAAATLFFLMLISWHSELPVNDSWSTPGRAMEMLQRGDFGANAFNPEIYRHNDSFKLFPVLAEVFAARLASGWSMMASVLMGAFFWVMTYLILNRIVSASGVSNRIAAVYAFVSGLIMFSPLGLPRLGLPFSVHRTLPIFLAVLAILLAADRSSANRRLSGVVQIALCAVAQLSFISGIAAWISLIAVRGWRAAAAGKAERKKELIWLGAACLSFLLFELALFAAGFSSLEHTAMVASEHNLSFAPADITGRIFASLGAFLFVSALEMLNGLGGIFGALICAAAVSVILIIALKLVMEAWSQRERAHAPETSAVVCLGGFVLFSLFLAMLVGFARWVPFLGWDPRYFCEVQFLGASLVGLVAVERAESNRSGSSGFRRRAGLLLMLSIGFAWLLIGAKGIFDLTDPRAREALRRTELKRCILNTKSAEEMVKSCPLGGAHVRVPDMQGAGHDIVHRIWRLTRESLR